MKKHISYLSLIFKTICIVFLFTAWTTTYSQSTGQNYIVTRSFTNAEGTTYQDKIDYLDGLGRPEQSVLKNASTSGADIVTLLEYDSLGRESNKWNPMSVANNAGQYVSQGTIKSGAKSMYSDQHPYSKPVYEPSALNRIQELYNPGEDWHLNSRSIKTTYLSNIAGDNLLNCVLYSTNSVLTTTNMVLTKSGNYASAELLVTKMEGEDGNLSLEFKNKHNQVLLTRNLLQTQVGTKTLDTYYIYDDFGNLAAVLPPEASDVFRMDNSASWSSNTNATLSDYAYFYKYDNRNLLIAKMSPGSSWQFYIYDKGARLIFTQDGNMRSRGEWAFSIPDMLGQVCFSGVCKNSLDVFSNTLSSVAVKADWRFDTASSTGAGPYKGYYLSGISLTTPTIMQANYYNDYSFLGKNGVPAESDARVKYDQSAETEGYGKRYQQSAQGLLTGNVTSRLSDSGVQSYSYSVVYYDSSDRIVQTRSNN